MQGGALFLNAVRAWACLTPRGVCVSSVLDSRSRNQYEFRFSEKKLCLAFGPLVGGVSLPERGRPQRA